MRSNCQCDPDACLSSTPTSTPRYSGPQGDPIRASHREYARQEVAPTSNAPVVCVQGEAGTPEALNGLITKSTGEVHRQAIAAHAIPALVRH
jgi:hypothetical protein